MPMLAILLNGSVVQAQSWRELSPNERYEAMRNYEEHRQLPSGSQKAVEGQYDRWRAMSPEEKDRVRSNYDKLRKMPPKERERFDRKADKWRRDRE